MTFTNDETGEKFEPTEPSVDNLFKEGYRVIRPINKPKWGIDGPHLDNDSAWDYKVNLSLGTTKDQAQLIKQSVEALMEYVTAPKFYNRPQGQYPVEFVQAVDSARQAFQKGTE